MAYEYYCNRECPVRIFADEQGIEIEPMCKATREKVVTGMEKLGFFETPEVICGGSSHITDLVEAQNA